MSLSLDLASRFREKLSRAAVVSASRWAETYRFIDEKPWSFKTHPWLREMHDTTYEENIGQKGAQLGYSETMINILGFSMDIKKVNVLYILPNQRPDATDFSNRALKPAIEMSPHMQKMFASGATDNVSLKQVGNCNLFIRGSNTRSALKSVPASVLIFDEFDEMEQDNIKLAEERSSGQVYRLNWKVSTPTIPGHGINSLFERSTKEHFFFPCPSCSRIIQLKFPDSIVITGDDPDSPEIYKTHLICYECKNRLPHEEKTTFLAKGRWVAENPGQIMRGFNINQMYSAPLPPFKLAQRYLEAMRDPTAEQEFFNSKLGLPHIVAGAQITEDMIGNLIKPYEMVESCRPSLITMGVDVNKTFNVEIDQWDVSESSPIDVNQKAKCRVIWAGEVSTIEDVGQFMTDYNVNFCVIDAMPETQLVTQFANNFFGRVRICRYNHYATARSLFAAKNDIQVSVNRTSWLDQSLGRFRNASIYLPRNIPRDYPRQIMALIRKPEKDTNGNLVYRYVHQESRPDHYAHARNYAEIALPFASGNVLYKSIKEKIL